MEVERGVLAGVALDEGAGVDGGGGDAEAVEERDEVGAGVGAGPRLGANGLEAVAEERGERGELGLQLEQLDELVVQEAAGLSGVGDRVLRGVADEEVVLDEAVVRVLREAEGREDEGVDDRLAEELEVRGAGAEGGEVVGEEVVAGGEDGEGREGVELGEGFAGAGGAAEGVVEVDRAEGADALGVAFEVPEDGGGVDGGDEREVARAELRRGGVLSLDGIVGARARGVWQLGLPVPVDGRPTFWPGSMGACEPRRGGVGANGTSGAPSSLGGAALHHDRQRACPSRTRGASRCRCSRHLVVRAPLEDAAGLLLVLATPLLEEERDA